MSSRGPKRFIATGALITTGLSGSISAGEWTATVLHPEGWSESQAFGTAASEHVGSRGEAGVGTFATLWAEGGKEFIDLNPMGANFSQALATTGAQQVGIASFDEQHAGLWRGSSESWVDLHPAGATSSEAVATSGTVQVGSVWLGEQHAALWMGSQDTFVDLHPIGASVSAAFGAADDIQVGAVVSPETHAAMWSGSAESVVDLHPGGRFSIALATDGTVQVGMVDERASLWFGTAESHVDIHPEGQASSRIVATTGTHHAGWVQVATALERHAAVWLGNDWVDVHVALPPGVYHRSEAASIVEHDGTLFVAGYAVIEASNERRAILWTAPAPAACIADLDGSGDVGLTDLLAVLSHWGPCPACPEDLDRDGLVGFTDLLIVLANWGPCE